MEQKKRTGMIFNIQKFSLHDGPGIRTVVFFKGCPLKCKWCANPESQSPNVQVLWDGDKCMKCGTCVRDCVARAISLSEGRIQVSESLCTGCRICLEHCPGRALKAEGEAKTVEEVLAVCLQDLDFYEESGGGVTLSGGEPLVHPDFAIALIRALKEHGIHTAIETTGFAAPEVFDQVTDLLDLLLFDIKHWDEQRHIAGTGVSNRLILDNMKRAIAAGKNVLPRLPVIPGFNDSLEDAAGFVKRLKEAGASRVQMLPFHQFGERKYEELGKDYEYTDVPALHEEDLEAFKQVFLDAGIHAFF